MIGRLLHPGSMLVVAQVALSQHHRVYVLKVAGRNLLVGASDGSLSVLAELDAIEVERALATEPARGRFAQLLARVRP